MDEASLHMSIFSNISIVVEVDKLMIAHLPIDGSCCDEEQQADPKITPHVQRGALVRSIA